MKLADYFALWQLSVRRNRSEMDYLHFQAFQAALLLDYLDRFGIAIKGKVLADLGSGVGGYSREFVQQGAQVIGVDLIQKLNFRSTSLLQICANASNIPLPDESVDIVFCASLVEHLPQPEAVLGEVERILKPGGYSYFSFPPYYSPRGGHEYAPFHYLGERLALRFVNHQKVLPPWVVQLHGVSGRPTTFATLYHNWGLNKMTIRRFRELLQQTSLACLDMSTRYMPVSFVRWPVLSEFLTWHAQFLVKKPFTK